MITVHDVEQGTEQWHNLRHGLYTGASAHRLLRFGAIPYSLTEKSSFKGNYHTKRGHILEVEAIELYEAIAKTKVNKPGFVTNDKYISCGYSPDGLTDSHVIEVKCFSQARHKQLHKDNINLEILAQIHFGMLICEKKQAVLLLYNPELEAKEALKIIDIKAKKTIEENFKNILISTEVMNI